MTELSLIDINARRVAGTVVCNVVIRFYESLVDRNFFVVNNAFLVLPYGVALNLVGQCYRTDVNRYS